MSVKEKLKNNDFLYCAVKYFQSRRNHDFAELVRGRYQFPYKSSSVMINHYGDAMPDQLVSNITMTVLPGQGFAGQVIYTLRGLDIAEVFHAHPVIFWGGVLIMTSVCYPEQKMYLNITSYLAD